MKSEHIIFNMEHLDKYAILDKPCTIIVKNNSSLDFDNIYDYDDHPRWIMNIKAIAKPNLDLLKGLTKGGTLLTYADMGHLLLTASIWEDQVDVPADLPAKGEDIIAVFDYVEEVLRCTNVTLIPRLQPDMYLYASDAVSEINEFEQIIKEMRDEK